MTHPLADAEFQLRAFAAIQSRLVREVEETNPRAFRLGRRENGLSLRLPILPNPAAEAFIQEFELAGIRSVAQRHHEELRSALLEGVRRGEGERELADRIRGLTQAREFLVKNIARTETNRASNWGRLSAWKQSGVVRRKEYVATHDDRVRATHLIADGEVVSIDATFTRGAAAGKLMPPVEPNCRCTAIPVTALSGLAAAAIRQGIPGLRALEARHEERLVAIWRSWPDVLARFAGTVPALPQPAMSRAERLAVAA